MITVIHAHPYPRHSKTNKVLTEAISTLPDVNIRSLYDLYPDFHIDVKTEQKALMDAGTIILQHPLYWYHTPALVAQWFEKVLSFGWAYGDHVQALKDKRFLWATTTGGNAESYSSSGDNHFSMEQIATPIQQTALFCGMQWLPPFITHDAGNLSDDQLLMISESYRDRVVEELTHLKLNGTGSHHAS